jgi:hypothetical protein
MRPTIVNGLENSVTRGDLASRTINVLLPQITGERKDEEEMQAELEKDLPAIFTGVLDALVVALKNKETAREQVRGFPKKPRMLDFFTFIIAAEPALPWESGKFAETFLERKSMDELTLVEGDPTIQYFIDFTRSKLLEAGKNEIEIGTTKFFEEFKPFACNSALNMGDSDYAHRFFKLPAKLTGHIHAQISGINALGIGFSLKKTNKGSYYKLWVIPDETKAE